jgi:hypothetical protein
MHRFIFHGKLGRLPVLKYIRKIHTMHHARPSDLEKAFFPNWVKVMIAAIMIAVVFISLPLAIGVCSFFPVYAHRHWTAHDGAKTNWAIHHMNHHLVNSGGIYPVIDVIFGTNEAVK